MEKDCVTYSKPRYKKISLKSIKFRSNKKNLAKKANKHFQQRLDNEKTRNDQLPKIEEEIRMLNKSLDNSPFKSKPAFPFSPLRIFYIPLFISEFTESLPVLRLSSRCDNY